MASKVRFNDEVVILAGKDKGKSGKITKVLTAEGKVFVEGINLIKKHQKPVPQLQQPGGIVEKEAAIHASNVMLFNPVTNKGERVGFKKLDDGRKVRIFKSTGEVADI